MSTSKPYGTWSSPISAAMLSGSMRLNDVQWSDDGQVLLWAERRSSGGVLVAQHGGDAFYDLTDSSMRVGGGVGYGGGAFTTRGEYAYVVGNGRLYRVPFASRSGQPQPLTPAFGEIASPAVSHDERFVAFVHQYEHRDSIAVVDSDGQQFPQKIAQGDDFVMQPTWHPSGTHLAYVAWNHPQMPWNGTELRLLTLHTPDNSLPVTTEETTLAGDSETAIFQPQFSPDGKYLAFVSDASGYGHIYLHELATGEQTQLTSGDVEHIIPAWIQGMRTIAWSTDSKSIYAIRSEKAFYSLWRYDITTGDATHIDALDDYTHLSQLSVSPQGNVAAIGSAPTIPPRIIGTDGRRVRIWRRATVETLPSDYLADAEPLMWKSDDGDDVHGLYYPPTNPDYDDPHDQLPPVIVKPHSGPTSQQAAEYEDEAQFFTSRGYGMLYVNYRGSTGYGKAYMNQHEGNWGVTDVEDCLSGAQHLVESGRADSDKLVIMGSSAGGFTVLQTLVEEPGFFQAGIVSYGVADQFLLAMDTHKFEERYSDWLLGALPDAADVYRQRSPVLHAQHISDPLLILQGDQDSVVPKSQADAIAGALRRNGTPHEYHVYEGEGHGFRQPETIHDFYNRVQDFLLKYVIYA